MCNWVFLETVVQRCSVKKVFLEISQNPQENTCARVTLSFSGMLWLNFLNDIKSKNNNTTIHLEQDGYLKAL